MKRLKKQASVQPIKEFIDKYYQKGQQSIFMEFRKAFMEQYKDKIKQYPLLDAEMSDMGYEAGDGLGLLYSIYSGNLVYELDGGMDQDEIYDNLIENEIQDFWMQISKLYKTEL
jgi:hypothetical protein